MNMIIFKVRNKKIAQILDLDTLALTDGFIAGSAKPGFLVKIDNGTKVEGYPLYRLVDYSDAAYKIEASLNKASWFPRDQLKGHFRKRLALLLLDLDDLLEKKDRIRALGVTSAIRESNEKLIIALVDKIKLYIK